MPDKCVESCADITRLEQQIKDLSEQNGADHKELRERLGEVEITNAVQNERYTTILKELTSLTNSHNELNRKLSELESKPAKRWDGLVEKAIWAVVAAVIAFLLAKIGLTS